MATHYIQQRWRYSFDCPRGHQGRDKVTIALMLASQKGHTEGGAGSIVQVDVDIKTDITQLLDIGQPAGPY
jgi:hypothetical protein